MRDVQCPACGESSDLVGRHSGEMITVSCGTCGERWKRDVTPRCALCGSDRLQYAPRPLWEKGRGDQRTPAGRIDAYSCSDCGGHDVTSSAPASTGAGESVKAPGTGILGRPRPARRCDALPDRSPRGR